MISKRLRGIAFCRTILISVAAVAGAVVIAVLTLTSAGCSAGKRASTADGMGVEEHVRADERNLEAQGQMLFSRLLRGLNSHEHFVLEAAFLTDDAWLTLHSHFNGYAWRDGVRVRFIRDHASLRVGIASPGMTEVVYELGEGWLTADGRMAVRVEVHNAAPGGPRVYIWKYALSLQGEQQSPRTFISGSNADFDSAEHNLTLPGHGRGVRWGLEFSQAKIRRAFGEAPYVE